MEDILNEQSKVESRLQRKERKHAKKLAKAANEVIAKELEVVAQIEESYDERKARKKAEKKAKAVKEAAALEELKVVAQSEETHDEQKARRKAEKKAKKKAEKKVAKEAEREAKKEVVAKTHTSRAGKQRVDEAGSGNSDSSDLEPIAGIKRKQDHADFDPGQAQLENAEDEEGDSPFGDDEEDELKLVNAEDIQSMGLDNVLAEICGLDEESDSEPAESKASVKKKGVKAEPGAKAPKKCKL